MYSNNLLTNSNLTLSIKYGGNSQQVQVSPQTTGSQLKDYIERQYKIKNFRMSFHEKQIGLFDKIGSLTARGPNMRLTQIRSGDQIIVTNESLQSFIQKSNTFSLNSFQRYQQHRSPLTTEAKKLKLVLCNQEQNFEISVDASWTGSQLESYIKTNYKLSNFRLMFNAKVIKDTDIIGELCVRKNKIQDGDRILLTFDLTKESNQTSTTHESFYSSYSNMNYNSNYNSKIRLNLNFQNEVYQIYAESSWKGSDLMNEVSKKLNLTNSFSLIFAGRTIKKEDVIGNLQVRNNKIQDDSQILVTIEVKGGL